LRFLPHVERGQRPPHEEAEGRRGGRERIGAHRDAADRLHIGSLLREHAVEQRAHQEVALGGQHGLLAVDVEVTLLPRRQRDLALLVREALEQGEKPPPLVFEEIIPDRHRAVFYHGSRPATRDGRHTRAYRPSSGLSLMVFLVTLWV